MAEKLLFSERFCPDLIARIFRGWIVLGQVHDLIPKTIGTVEGSKPADGEADVQG